MTSWSKKCGERQFINLRENGTGTSSIPRKRLAFAAWMAASFTIVAVVCQGSVWADALEPPPSRKFPAVEVIPEPHHQASFVYVPLHQELCRFHFGQDLHRPFLYPVVSPDGWPLTRMGHPYDPVSHSHHNSVWISHADVNGFDFWSDRAQTSILCDNITEYNETSGDFQEAWLVAELRWVAEGRTLLKERRRVRVIVPTSEETAWRTPRESLARGYFIVIESEFTPVGEKAVFGQTAFGLIGARMAKPIGVRDGGGRILNSDGLLNEAQAFRKPAKWVDYSGHLTPTVSGGITLFDHPQNEGFPHPFHVRDDGWMGICLSLNGSVTIPLGEKHVVRYGLWCHSGIPDLQLIEQSWQMFVNHVPSGTKPQ